MSYVHRSTASTGMGVVARATGPAARATHPAAQHQHASSLAHATLATTPHTAGPSACLPKAPPGSHIAMPGSKLGPPGAMPKGQPHSTWQPRVLHRASSCPAQSNNRLAGCAQQPLHRYLPLPPPSHSQPAASITDAALSWHSASSAVPDLLQLHQQRGGDAAGIGQVQRALGHLQQRQAGGGGV
jgi:hypothetical protein